MANNGPIGSFVNTARGEGLRAVTIPGVGTLVRILLPKAEIVSDEHDVLVFSSEHPAGALIGPANVAAVVKSVEARYVTGSD